MSKIKLKAISIATLIWGLFAFSMPTFAGETLMNLLSILRDKGTISQDEYNALVNAAKTEDSEKNEVNSKEKTQSVKAPVTDQYAVLPDALQGLNFEMTGYLDYSAGQTGTAGGGSGDFNRFSMTRGYLTVKKQILPRLSARITTDINQDDKEDWKVRLKYLYAEFQPDDLGLLTNMKSEIGLGHVAWHDFEEHINPYRMQGTMAIERAGIFNSADLGVSLRGNLGGTLENAQALTGNRHYNGRWGSWHVGVYNGGGYHAKEHNNNKVFEGRFTLRPVPDYLPGLQLSYLGIFGKGNTAWNPDYQLNLGMLSYEHPRWTFTAQYFATEGNAAGTLVDPAGKSLHGAGYSFFGKVRLPMLNDKLSLFARYDNVDPDADGVMSNDAGYQLAIAGLSYQLFKNNMIILDYERSDHGGDSGGVGKGPVIGNHLGDDQRFQAVYQLDY